MQSNSVSNGSNGGMNVLSDSASKQWQTTAKKTLLNLSTSNSDVVSFVMREMNDEKISPGKQAVISFLIGERSVLSSALSNMLKTISDARREITRNI